MSKTTRKYLWPVSLAMSLALVGVLAAFVALSAAGSPTVQAHDPCAGITDIEQLAECLANEEADPHAHETDAANTDPMATGAFEDVKLRINMTHGPIDVSGEFEDADGDTLTFEATSDNRNVANATIAGKMMTVVAGSIRGTARIMVTADDGGGGTAASLTFVVTVAENYILTADPQANMQQLMELQDSLEADNPLREMLMRVPHGAIYVVEEEDAEYEALFHLAVAGSADDVTVTITAREPEAGGITITDSDGLLGAGFVDDEETDLEGSLTIKATDAGSRAFEIEGMCESVGAFAIIMVDDKDLDEVAEGAVLCEQEPETFTDRDDRSDLYTVVSYGDWDLDNDGDVDDDDVTDGFIIQDEDGVVQMVHGSLDLTGWIQRDEPVVATDTQESDPDDVAYRLGYHGKEHLTQRNDPEEGQHTIEVLVGAPNVQLTVTATEEGPAYIRFLDKYGMPFGTDVDEEESERGADVVGLDSQGKLELKNEVDLSNALALAYDQYGWTVPGNPDYNAYLTGIGGKYWQGNFRFFDPCTVEEGEGHYFYVEVYEKTDKYKRTTEKVLCVPSPRPGPTGLEFTVDSQEPGEGTLEYQHALNAASHTVLVIEADSRVAVQEIPDADSEEMITGLRNGWEYHFVVIAEGLSQQYTADAITSRVTWLGEDLYTGARPSTPAPTGMHILCQTDLMALLADCDDPNAAPMAVGTIAAVSVTEGQMSEMDVSGYFSDADMDDTLTYTAMSDMTSYATVSVSGSMVTINGVAAGSAIVTVTATDAAGASAMQTIMVTVEAADMTLGAPGGVMSSDATTDPGTLLVKVDWTPGNNAVGHLVMLFTDDWQGAPMVEGTPTGNSHTFTVDAGSYIAVVVAYNVDGSIQLTISGVTTVGGS